MGIPLPEFVITISVISILAALVAWLIYRKISDIKTERAIKKRMRSEEKIAQYHEFLKTTLEQAKNDLAKKTVRK